MRRVGVLASGRGSNLQALLAAAESGELGGTVVLVVCNLPGAPALAVAERAGIPARVLPHRGRGREEHEAEVHAALRAEDVELVCLAGYLRRLSPAFVRAWSGRLLNVHPSLLPAFPGLEAQRQAWEHGVKVSGATVHFVTEDLDAGPIVAQEAVPVREDDSPEDLARRILEAEHRIYPRAVRAVLEGRCRLEGRRVRVEEGA